jgi:hypothetical protein
LDFLEEMCKEGGGPEEEEDTLEAGTEAVGFQEAALMEALENLAALNAKLEVMRTFVKLIFDVKEGWGDSS